MLKFSAKLRQDASWEGTSQGAPIQGPGAGSWNGLHPAQGLSVRPGGRSGGPGGGVGQVEGLR